MNWFFSSVARWPWLWSLVVTLVSLGAGGFAFVMADFGQPLWLFAPLFLWLATIGLPSTMGVILVASAWGRFPGLFEFEPFVACAAVAAFAFQAAGFHCGARFIRPRFRGNPCT